MQGVHGADSSGIAGARQSSRAAGVRTSRSEPACERYSERVTNRFRADLHVHSRYSDASGSAGIRALRSAESFTDPVELYHAQRARGMDFVTITDHNTLAGSLAIAHLPGTFLSAELDSWFPEDGVRVHVVALGIDEPAFAAANQARENVHDLVACLREAGVVHYLAHPLFDMSGKLTPESVERMLLLFDVLEGRNGARTSRCNGLLRAIAGALTPEQVEAMAERQGIEPYGETPWRKTLTGGSDDHSGLFSASAFTVAGGDGTAEGFLRALAAGDCDHGGADGDARLLAHSIYAASFWKIREILRLDDEDQRKRALGLLRKGFGRIGRDVPVLEKTVSGVRSIAPGLYRGGDPRGPAWEKALEREIGTLVADPDGINAVDARELNRRLFVVAQRLADDVMGHAPAGAARPGGARQPQAPAAEPVRGRHGGLPGDPLLLRLELPEPGPGPAGRTARVLPRRAPAHAAREGGRAVRVAAAVAAGRRRGRPRQRRAGCGAAVTSRPRRHPADLLRGSEPVPAGAMDFRALAWRPAPDGAAPGWVIPPLVEIVDYLEEEEFSAIHTDSAAAQGLVALAAARLLHLPVTGAADPQLLEAPRGPGDVAGRLRRRYRAWFYGRLDEVYAPTPAAAGALAAAGVEPSRITLLPAASES